MKNNKFIIFAWILMSGIYSCTKENINQLSLDVKLTGKVELHSQFGEKLDNYEAVTILLDDAQNKSEYVLNEEGYYHISGIKTGVYNLTITANGFVTRQIKGLQLLGGDETIYKNYWLFQPSSALISELHFTANEAGRLSLAGYWKNPLNSAMNYYQRVAVFTHNAEDISVTNYSQVQIMYISPQSDGYFQRDYYLPTEKAPVYCLVCTLPYSGYDLAGHSQPSNIAIYYYL